MAKKPSTKKVVTPEPVKGAKVVQEFEEVMAETGEVELFTIRMDNKKIESRTLEQVIFLMQGSAGAFKKIVVEKEK